MSIWVLISPKHPKCEAVRKAISALAKKLEHRDSAWCEGTGEQDDWALLQLTVPLTRLLAAEDQEKALADFVSAGLADLKAVGALDAVIKACAASRGGK